MTLLKILCLSVTLFMSSLAWAGNININTADADTLSAELSGIGMKKAQAIVDYRNTYGQFSSIDDLVNVKGVSTKTLEKNRNKLSVE